MEKDSLQGKDVFIPLQSDILIGKVVGTIIQEEPLLVPSFDEETLPTLTPAGSIFHVVEIVRNRNAENQYFAPGTKHTFSKEMIFPLDEQTE